MGVLALHTAWDAFPAGLTALGVAPPSLVADLLLALLVGLPGLGALLVTMRRVAPPGAPATADPPCGPRTDSRDGAARVLSAP